MRSWGARLVAVATAIMLVALTAPSYAGEVWVFKAQRRLNSLGCLAGKADGILDEQVRTAVIRFQAANALAQTGGFNDTTRTRLRSDRAKRCDVRAVPARSGKGRRIVLSQRQNWVWLVKADGTVKAQGGMVDNDWLPTGTYTTGSKCGRPGRVLTNTAGSLWLYYFVRFADCGVGFHQVPVYMSNGQQIHPDWYLGTNLKESHGCIRLKRSFVQTLWTFTTSTTKVVVVQGT